MVISVGKLAPRVAAVAMVGYCIWPSLVAFTSKPEVKQAAKPLQLAAGLLSPKPGPVPARNPFIDEKAAKLAAEKRAVTKKRVVATKRAAEAAKLVTTAKGKSLNPLNGFTLEATCILGDRRLAVINGQVYSPADTLPVAKSAPSYKIVDVLPHKVLLESQGKELELTYPDTSAKPASVKSATRTAKAGTQKATTKSKKSGGASKKKAK